MKYTTTNLVNMAKFGTIKGVNVILMVEVEASKDRRFKLRCQDITDSRGWDFGEMHTKCYEVLNDDISFDEAFDGFIQDK
jgi:hypothetical protein